jgi:hypothetical protein
VEGKADHQHRCERDLARVGGHADRQALGEVVQPDRERDRHAGAQGGLLGRVGLRLIVGHLGSAHGLAARHRRPDPSLRQQPSLNRRDTGGAGQEADGHQGEQGDHVPQAAAVVLERGERGVDYLLAVRGHVHEDEREDADREHRQPGPEAILDALDPPHGEAQVDRETGDCTQQRGLSKGQCSTPRTAIRDP